MAAALVEYDNDLSNPGAPYRSAHDSAIFSTIRQSGNARPQTDRRKSNDYLGVALPSEGGSVSGAESALDKRHKKAVSSINVLRNPFGGEDDDEPEKEGLEVDLRSWGLDAFMPNGKGEKNMGRTTSKSSTFPNPHPVSSLRQNSAGAVIEPRGRSHGSRSLSMGTFDALGGGGAFLDAPSTLPARPRSVGDILDTDDASAYQRPRRESVHALIESMPAAPALHSVPFPSGGSRSNSPYPRDGSEHASRPGSRGSGYLLDPGHPPHNRTSSYNSLGSRKLLDGADEMFTARPPSPDRASRFDPKVNRARANSNASMGTMLIDESNTFAVRPPSISRSSRFDPKMAAHARTLSNNSLGSRMLLDNDGASVMGGASVFSGKPAPSVNRPYSTIELLRPKVLIMPSPLQSTVFEKPTPLRDGFHLLEDGAPLPPGARSSRGIATAFDPGAPASQMFTGNPRTSMTLSQLAFRNTLMVGGERDIAYSDIDRNLPRATEEGEQAEIWVEESQEQPAAENYSITGRPAGKLFGKSLIDALEIRKANMRSKQRVFTGDNRPSMMARGQGQQSAAYYDPETLQRPVSNAGFQPPNLARGNSAGGKPLLNFGEEAAAQNTLRPVNSRAPTSRSVFGTDKLWEREMEKLKIIEAEEQEAKEAEEKRVAAQAALEEHTTKKKKKKGKGKTKADSIEADAQTAGLDATIEPIPRVSSEPPMLPILRDSTVVRGPPPPVDDDDTDEESEDSAQQAPARRKARRGSAETAANRWAESSDEEGPRRTPGVGLRYPNKPADNAGDDSEEDMPLAATMSRALHRVMSSGGDDSDEDVPLAAMLDKPKSRIPPVNFDGPSKGSFKRNEEDDDQPLGLRASRMPVSYGLGSQAGGGDEDDVPLALHPDQQRKAQYMAIAQQQQMMMQAQMQQSMFYGNPAMMASGFFGPPMGPMPVMSPPMQQPPAQEVNTFGRVDQWRHDVAVKEPPAA